MFLHIVYIVHAAFRCCDVLLIVFYSLKFDFLISPGMLTITACPKEAEASFPLPLTGPCRLEGKPLSQAVTMNIPTGPLPAPTLVEFALSDNIIRNHMCLFDSEESLWSGWNALRGALRTSDPFI